MELKLQELIDLIRSEMDELTDEEVGEVLDEITRGYCRECWSKTNGRTCHCQNDA